MRSAAEDGSDIVVFPWPLADADVRPAGPPPLTDAERALVFGWLDGEVKSSSAEGRKASRLIADVFRQQRRASLGFRVQLANMFDPDMRDSLPMRLDVRPNGKHETHSREIAIYVEACLRAGRSRTDALDETRRKFGVSIEKVQKDYKVWGSAFDKLKALRQKVESTKIQ
jgi:hypothetical protein